MDRVENPNMKENQIMKYPRYLTIIALLALAIPAHAQTSPDTDRMHNRFEQMDQMMKDADKAQGENRMQMMHEHMEMMRNQMQAMHGMMGQRHGGNRMGPGGGPQMHMMQERMDMMQRMMEQIQKQHELMMKPDDKN